MKRSIAARIASEIVEYVPPFTSWWRAFTLSGGSRIVTRSDSDGIERPASPRFLSDVRMTSALFKHMSNRDFPGGMPLWWETEGLGSKGREHDAYSARIRLFFGLCSTSARRRASKTGGTYMPRSEERRVGKECRSRWSAYH